MNPFNLYRVRARKALSGNWPTALLVTLIAAVPSLIMTAAQTMSSVPVSLWLSDVLTQLYAGSAPADASVLYRQLFSILMRSAGPVWIAAAAAQLLLPFLGVGRDWYSLRLLREGNATVRDAMSRVSCFFKAIALQLLTGLYVLLWSLPGLAMIVLGALIGSVSFALTLLFAGYGIMFFLMIRAALHAHLATFFLADHPERGPVRCLRDSVAAMRTNKGQLVSLLFFAFLVNLAAGTVSSLLAGLSMALGMTVEMIINLAVSAYITLAVAGLYDAVACGWKPPVPEAPAAGEDLN